MLVKYKKSLLAGILLASAVSLSGCEFPIAVAGNCNDFPVTLVSDEHIDTPLDPMEVATGLGPTMESYTRFHNSKARFPDGSVHPVTVEDYETFNKNDNFGAYCSSNPGKVIVPLPPAKKG